MEKLIIKEAIIVEGKYDKIKLDSIINGLIIPVHGFGVFANKPLQKLIVELGKTKGIIILMDSDSSGFKIRGFIHGIVPPQYRKDVYIPDVMGKEKRKTEHSKEGKIGVEGIEAKVLRKAFGDAGVVVSGEEPVEVDVIIQQDFLNLGLIGETESAVRRKCLYEAAGIPERINTKNAVKLLNTMMTREELFKLVNQLF